MKREPLYITEQIVPLSASNAIQSEKFIRTLQTAVLLSLLEKGQLSKRQFDLCFEKLHKQEYTTSQEGEVRPYICL